MSAEVEFQDLPTGPALSFPMPVSDNFLIRGDTHDDKAAWPRRYAPHRHIVAVFRWMYVGRLSLHLRGESTVTRLIHCDSRDFGQLGRHGGVGPVGQRHNGRFLLASSASKTFWVLFSPILSRPSRSSFFRR